MTYKDILVELPLIVHNSHLLTSFLHQMPAMPSAELEFPTSLSDIKGLNPELPLYPAYETTLDMSIDPFLEKSCDLLLDAVESHYTELNNFQYVTNLPHLTILLTTLFRYYQRQLAREQTKVTAWQTKRKAENAGRVAAGQAPLPEDDWKTLFKLPTEPSRLESMLLARQVEQYGRTVDNFTATISAKMFLSKDTLLPGESS